MHSLDSLFLSTKQPQKKLEIAISRFFVDRADPNGQYRLFLQKRLRPAILWIIRNGSAQMLTGLLNCFTPNEALMLEAVRLCSSLGRAEMTAILLKSKQSGTDISVQLFYFTKISVRTHFGSRIAEALSGSSVFRPCSGTAFLSSLSFRRNRDRWYFLFLRLRFCDPALSGWETARSAAAYDTALSFSPYPASGKCNAHPHGTKRVMNSQMRRLQNSIQSPHTMYVILTRSGTSSTDTPCTSDHSGGDSSDPSLSHTQLKKNGASFADSFHIMKSAAIYLTAALPAAA